MGYTKWESSDTGGVTRIQTTNAEAIQNGNVKEGRRADNLQKANTGTTTKRESSEGGGVATTHIWRKHNLYTTGIVRYGRRSYENSGQNVNRQNGEGWRQHTEGETRGYTKRGIVREGLRDDNTQGENRCCTL